MGVFVCPAVASDFVDEQLPKKHIPSLQSLKSSLPPTSVQQSISSQQSTPSQHSTPHQFVRLIPSATHSQQLQSAPAVQPVLPVLPVILASSSSSLHSSEPLAEVERPHPSVARIVAFDSQGQQFGSGTLVDEYGDYGVVITNWHVIDNCNGLVHVHFPNGFSSFGAVVASDQRWDLAVLLVSKTPLSTPKLSIAKEVPRVGDPLWIVGYGAGTYRMAGGRCLRFLAPEIENGKRAEFDCIELSIDARLGDSGGPILNQDGEVAGVLFGSDLKNTAGSHCGRVRSFVKQTLQNIKTLPTKPEEYFAQIEPNGPAHRLADTRKPIVMAK
ncbi:MAG: serine protease [Planctomycetaceae bacterium]|nr:serine protease [Planctomycetaceae bacterium]